eukprot:85901_1
MSAHSKTVEPGKRHFEENNAFTQWDFLRHHDITCAETEGFRPIAHSSTTRFKQGFYRRPLEKICPGMEKKKLEDEDNKIERSAKHLGHRRSFLTKKINANGDIVKGSDPIVKPTKHIDDQRGRRHFDNPRLADREQVIRDRTSVYRFYTSDIARQQHPNRSVKQSSSILGFGRTDLPSEGVVDNFIGHGYADGRSPVSGAGMSPVSGADRSPVSGAGRSKVSESARSKSSKASSSK